MGLPENPNDDHYLGGYLKNHAREAITYILLVLGIVLLFFFEPFYYYGGILVGIVAGIYFSDEIIGYVLHWKMIAETASIPRNLILLGVILAFFISAPAIFLGGAVAIAIKQLFISQGFDK